MQDPFVGTWKLNVGRSEFDEHHQPAAGALVFEIDAEGHYLMRAQGVNAKGEQVVERPTRLVVDGLAHPIAEAPGLTTITTRPDPHTIHSEAKREDGSTVGSGTFVVSPNGKWLTATNFGYDSQLRQFRQRTVWDRVERSTPE